MITTGIKNEIDKLEKLYAKQIKEYYKSVSGLNCGDSDLYRIADKTSKKKQYLIDALELIEKSNKI
jgi:hypothetical protein